jgi:hypothetical protein
MRNLLQWMKSRRALLNQRDDTIAELLQQCLQYSQQLTLVQDLAHRNPAVKDSSSILPHEGHKQQISEPETANHQLEGTQNRILQRYGSGIGRQIWSDGASSFGK